VAGVLYTPSLPVRGHLKEALRASRERQSCHRIEGCTPIASPVEAETWRHKHDKTVLRLVPDDHPERSRRIPPSSTAHASSGDRCQPGTGRRSDRPAEDLDQDEGGTSYGRPRTTARVASLSARTHGKFAL
jgi:hypothetical protein